MSSQRSAKEKRNLSKIEVNPLNYPLPHKIDPYVNEPDQTCRIVSILNDSHSRVSMQISNLPPNNLATFELH